MAHRVRAMPSASINMPNAEADLDDDRSLIETDGNLVARLLVRNTPCSFQAVAQGILESVCGRVPYLDRSVFRTAQDDGQGRVEDGERYVGRMRLECLHARLGMVIPYLDQPIRQSM
jgi:hypothetical protein